MAYGNYRGRCGGRIMYFLYKMDASSDYWAKIGNHTVLIGKGSGHTYAEIPVAEISWIWNTDIPEFKWIGEKEYWNTDFYIQERYKQAVELSKRIHGDKDWRGYKRGTPPSLLEAIFQEDCPDLHPRSVLEDISGVNFSQELILITRNMKSGKELKDKIKEWWNHYHGSAWNCIPNEIYDEATHVLQMIESQ